MFEVGGQVDNGCSDEWMSGIYQVCLERDHNKLIRLHKENTHEACLKEERKHMGNGKNIHELLLMECLETP